MRSERWWLLGGNLLTSLSTALGQSPYTNEVCNTYTLFSLWTIVQSVTQSLNTLAYDITSLKTLTRPFVKKREDIKC